MAKKTPRTSPPGASPDATTVKSPVVRANIMNRQLSKSPSFATLYSNDTQVQITPWDIRLVFGLIQEVQAEPPMAVIEQVGEVRMSLQHAKRIMLILVEQLKNYEQNIGPIPLPPD